MKNIKLTLAYEGTSFYGWQETFTGPSIEGHLRNILELVLQEKICLQAASRTDRGVHAEGQIANFFTYKQELDCDKLQKSLNGLLPPAIRILEVEEMAWSFHPTLDAIGKAYSYEICYGSVQLPISRHTSWHVPHPLNFSLIEAAIKQLEGTHDFSAFCNQRKNLRYIDKNRSVFAIHYTLLENHHLRFEIRGDHFLYKMVRNLVGTLIDIGREKLSLDDLMTILAEKNRALAGVTAPAHGLTLKKIFYPSI